MNNDSAKSIRAFLKANNIDIKTPEGRKIYKHVKSQLANNKIEALLASEKKN